MRLAKKCRNCWEFFEIERPLVLKFYCDKEECQEKSSKYLKRIKKTRFISMKTLDIYDLDRPDIVEVNGEKKQVGYKRVCRICGQPIRNKDGSYSRYKRYCSSKYCTGYKLFDLFNWTAVSKGYAQEIRRKNLKQINKKIKTLGIDREDLNNLKYNFTLCEQCGELSFLWRVYSITIRKYNLQHIGVINIHHITPVHTLTWDNIHLIWDKRNLIALCENCHHKQDHKLSKAKTEILNNKKITEFLGVDN